MMHLPEPRRTTPLRLVFVGLLIVAVGIVGSFAIARLGDLIS